MTQAIIFDLDGTLVDSLPDLVRTVNAAMGEYGAPPVDAACVRAWIGCGSRVLLGSALRHHGIDTEAPDFEFEDMYARFLEHYLDHLTGESRLFPGVASALQSLAASRFRMAVCTNKPSRFVGPLLRWLGVDDYFSILLGGDALSERKPHPAPLLSLAGQFGCSPADCLMVGDSRYDIEAARAAGMPVVAVSYGYAAQGELAAHPADGSIDNLECLLEWLAGRGVPGAAALAGRI
jgi:phosphoglycolate phosphatase